MFGALRLALALAVAAGHLYRPTWLGTYAVFGFYIISGYLMCRVLNGRYGFTPRGVARFALNRVLRIYPPYWAALLLTIALLLVLGDESALGFSRRGWKLPVSLEGWGTAITLFGSSDTRWRLMPGSWALRVELVYYAAIALGLGRGGGIALAWFGASLAYHVYLVQTGAPWSERYYPIAAASLPFSLGAILYHFRSELSRHLRCQDVWLVVGALSWVGNAVLAGARGEGFSAPHFYASCAITCVLVLLLALRSGAPEAVRSLDSRLGDLAYPVYLLHMQTGLLLWTLFPLPRRGLSLALWVLPALLGLAWLMLRAVSDPVERLRERVKRPES